MSLFPASGHNPHFHWLHASDSIAAVVPSALSGSADFRVLMFKVACREDAPGGIRTHVIRFTKPVPCERPVTL